jgi:UPF0716 protein FxsA
VLVILFLVVPIVELYIIVQIASSVGIFETIGLLILVSVVGAWLVRSQGLTVLGRVQGQLAMGNVPGKEMVDGLLILFAGALMLTPGFMTDAFGMLLLIPPTRAVVRTILVRRYRNSVVLGGSSAAFGGRHGSGRFGGSYFTDVDEVDDDGDPPLPPIELGPADR